jgi:GDPmannose 4,6-dehydratase
MSVAFVTGITGQDGGYLAEQLTAEGVEVHGLVHSADGSRADLFGRTPSVVLHEGDLGDPSALADLVAEIAPDEIYNLGGLSSVAHSWEEPLLTAQVNGLGAAGLLEAAWQLRERTGREVRVVQASSAEIFGLPQESPQNEQTPIRPASPYGAAKAFAHTLNAVYRSRGLHAVSCVLYNHESPRRPVQFVTRKITRAAAEIALGRQDVLSLGNLDARRDWGWAPEYVAAMVLAARHHSPDDYVIATGRSHSVGEFVAAAFARAGIQDWQRHVTVDDRFVRPVDATELVGDSSRAFATFGWRPQVSFEDLVGRMVEHDLREASA